MTPTTKQVASTFSCWFEDWEGHLDPYGLLHAIACAGTYLEQGEELDAAVRRALTTNLEFDIVPCAYCGQEFLSELGRPFCTRHCYRQSRDEGCPDGCRYCESGTKPLRTEPRG